MSKFIKSKIVAWLGVALAITVTVLSMCFENVPWWEYSVAFFAFMSCFLHLLAVYMDEKLPVVSYKLDMAALVCGVCLIVAFIILMVTDSVIFGF